MNLVELHSSVMEELETFVVAGVLPALKGASDGAVRDVLDTDNSYYYQWLACLMRVLKPQRVVELGGAMGVSAIVMLESLPAESKLYSITLPENGLEFSYIKTEYPNLIKVVANDRDINVWPKDLDWGKTDVLFVDAEHTKDEVQRELDTYLPLIGPGRLVIMDDIKLNPGMWEVWLGLDKNKLDVSELHHSGFGIFES